jgi:predicted NBD/HSP70 family sugar kinase
MRSATVLELRRRNRAMVLRMMLLDGPATRAGLAERSDLSAGTVSNVVSDLLTDGLVMEAGTEESNGGRPRVGLQVNPEGGRVVGVDIGETALTVELFDMALRRRDQIRVPVTSDLTRPQDIAAQLDAAIDRLLRGSEALGVQLRGIGIGVPGIVEYNPTPIVHAQSLGWDAIPFRDLLASRSVPVLVDNGAKTLTRAEMWLGAGRGVRHGAVVLIGTGVGAAVINDGAIYRGAKSTATEWGHTKVAVGGRQCRCGARGCLEAYIGAPAVLARWAELGGKPPHKQEAAIGAWRSALDAGESAARGVLEEVVATLGASLGDLVNLYNPEKIILGGWVGLELGRAALGAIDEAMRENALRTPAAEVSLVPSQVGPDAVALGAALLPIEQMITVG